MNSKKSLLKNLGIFAGLWIAFTIIVACRYPFAYTVPNFYAEDGKIFVANILEYGPAEATVQLFNGYLVVGQYAVANVGMAINAIFGSGLITAPKAIAIASYAFFGLMSVLPWLLFRKQIGVMLSLVAGVLIALVPLGAADWTVIGTIGNLKFAFLYIAFLLILYRNRVIQEGGKYIKILVADIVLLLCVVTNITVLALIPLAILPYIGVLGVVIKQKKYNQLISYLGVLNLLVIFALCLVYILVIYSIGIPKTPGYLDDPINVIGLINTVYRASLYGMLYPLQSTMTTILAVVLLILSIASLSLIERKIERRVAVSGLYAIAICVFGFVLNRTGVTLYYVNPTVEAGPGQFFYGGTMIFIFVVCFVAAPYLRRLSTINKRIAYLAFGVYLVWAVPLAGFREQSLAKYATRPSIAQAVEAACADGRSGERVRISIYPTDEWYMEASRSVVCRN